MYAVCLALALVGGVQQAVAAGWQRHGRSAAAPAALAAVSPRSRHLGSQSYANAVSRHPVYQTVYSSPWTPDHIDFSLACCRGRPPGPAKPPIKGVAAVITRDGSRFSCRAGSEQQQQPSAARRGRRTAHRSARTAAQTTTAAGSACTPATMFGADMAARLLRNSQSNEVGLAGMMPGKREQLRSPVRPRRCGATRLYVADHCCSICC